MLIYFYSYYRLKPSKPLCSIRRNVLTAFPPHINRIFDYAPHRGLMTASRILTIPTKERDTLI